jgi:hypothetical protein
MYSRIEWLIMCLTMNNVIYYVISLRIDMRSVYQGYMPVFL